MATTKMILSGSTDGKPIKIAATSTAGTAVHASHATNLDEVWLFAFNSHTAAVVLTIEFGGASAPDQNIVQSIPAKAGEFLVVPGLVLTNSCTVKAFAATTNVVTVAGFVNRIA